MTTRRRTPYDDQYPTCERTLAKLRIYSADLVPEIVSTQMRMEPTSIQRVGEVFENSLGRKRTSTLNAWFLSSERHVESRDLRRHLDWLLERLGQRREAILQLQTHHGLSIDLTCVWWSAHGEGGPTLWPEQMRAIANLELECLFDIGFYGAEQD